MSSSVCRVLSQTRAQKERRDGKDATLTSSYWGILSAFWLGLGCVESSTKHGKHSEQSRRGVLLDLAEQTLTKIWMTIGEVGEPTKELAKELRRLLTTPQARLSFSQM